MAISSICIKCAHLHPPIIGKRNKRYYTCDAFPEGKPEDIHQDRSWPYKWESNYLNGQYDTILCNNGVHWEPIDPIAKEMVKLFGVVIENINSGLSEEEREQLNSNCYEHPPLPIRWADYLYDLVGIPYDHSAPEAVYLENILSRSIGNDTLSGKIQSYVSFAGYNDQVLGYTSHMLWDACSPDEQNDIYRLIMQPDVRTAQNIVIDNYRYAQFTQNPMQRYWMVHKEGLTGKMIRTFIGHFFSRLEPFNYRQNTCISCGNRYNTENLVYLSLLKCGKDLMQKIVQGMHTINDCVVCNNCLDLPSPFYWEPRSEGQLLQELAELHKRLGFVPPQNFRSYCFLSKLEVTPKEILELLKLIQTMLPYSYREDSSVGPLTYKRYFGDWLTALKKAVIIDESGIKNHFGYRCKAVDGHICHSLAERKVDDFFNDNHISHEREPFYPYDPELNINEMMRGDWLIDNKVFVEFFGLIGNTQYDEKTEKKIELLEKNSIPYILLFPGEEYKLEEKFKDFINL